MQLLLPFFNDYCCLVCRYDSCLACIVVFTVTDHSFLVALPFGLILAWPVVFDVADHSFLIAFFGGLIHAWLVVFVHDIWVSHVVAFLDRLDFCLGWYLIDSAKYLRAVELQRPFIICR